MSKVTIIMPFTTMFFLLIIFSVIEYTVSKPANLVKLKNPGDAVCLDGTPPGYYYRPGTGENINNWIIHLEGGGWCYSEDDCLQRSRTNLGSSTYWSSTAVYGGFLSDSPLANPDFYNWNMVFVKYCDGASFTGNLNHPVNVQGTMIYFRGFRILQAVLEELLEKGMSRANAVVLTGCSAGGLATYYHADYVHSVLPNTVTYHALADAGYFIDVKSVDGNNPGKTYTPYVFKMQNCTVNQKCIDSTINDTEQWKCLFAPYTYPYISSPIFTFNSQYDTWQIDNVLKLKCHPPNCTPKQMSELQHFFREFQTAARPIVDSQTNGAFFDSCLEHCQSLSDHTWNQIKVGGQTAAKTFGNWYFKRSGSTKEIDCAYPCNTSC